MARINTKDLEYVQGIVQSEMNVELSATVEHCCRNALMRDHTHSPPICQRCMKRLFPCRKTAPKGDGAADRRPSSDDIFFQTSAKALEVGEAGIDIKKSITFG